MKNSSNENITDPGFTAIARELRLIRILLFGLLLLLVTALSSFIDKELSLIVLLIGILVPIVWVVIAAMVKRSLRAQHETETFARLSGRSERVP